MNQTSSPTYRRRCDECREFYMHKKGAATGWCRPCAEKIQRLVSDQALSHGYHLPYAQPFDHAGER